MPSAMHSAHRACLRDWPGRTSSLPEPCLIVQVRDKLVFHGPAGGVLQVHILLFLLHRGRAVRIRAWACLHPPQHHGKGAAVAGEVGQSHQLACKFSAQRIGLIAQHCTAHSGSTNDRAVPSTLGSSSSMDASCVMAFRVTAFGGIAKSKLSLF